MSAPIRVLSLSTFVGPTPTTLLRVNPAFHAEGVDGVCKAVSGE